MNDFPTTITNKQTNKHLTHLTRLHTYIWPTTSIKQPPPTSPSSRAYNHFKQHTVLATASFCNPTTDSPFSRSNHNTTPLPTAYYSSSSSFGCSSQLYSIGILISDMHLVVLFLSLIHYFAVASRDPLSETMRDAIQTMYLCSCMRRVQWCFIPTKSSPSIHNCWHYRDVIPQCILTMSDTRSNWCIESCLLQLLMHRTVCRHKEWGVAPIWRYEWVDIGVISVVVEKSVVRTKQDVELYECTCARQREQLEIHVEFFQL